MDKPRATAAYVLPFVCLVCVHCAKDPVPPGPCNDLAADAPAHDYTYASASAPLPKPTGGTIEDGLYYEYSTEIFDPTQATVPSGAQRSVTTLIAGQTWQAAYKVIAPSGTEAGTDTYMISPAPTGTGPGQLVMTRTCPTDRPMSTLFGYSFSGSGPGATLQLIFNESPPIVYTLTRQ